LARKKAPEYKPVSGFTEGEARQIAAIRVMIYGLPNSPGGVGPAQRLIEQERQGIVWPELSNEEIAEFTIRKMNDPNYRYSCLHYQSEKRKEQQEKQPQAGDDPGRKKLGQAVFRYAILRTRHINWIVK
jgi:hypothetical protein